MVDIRLRILDLGKQPGGEFTEFSFYFIYPRLEVEEANNLDTSTSADKKVPMEPNFSS